MNYTLSQLRNMVSPSYTRLSINGQCDALGVQRSSYYYMRCGESALNLEIMRLIDEQYLSKPFWGVPRMFDWLVLDKGFVINYKRVERLWGVMGLCALGPVPHTSKPSPKAYKYPYLLRGLKIEYPNQVWATDITYIPMYKGFLYLTAIIDLYSRYILNWSLSNSMEASWCADLLKDSLKMYPAPKIFNSDQGSQYTSDVFNGVFDNSDIKRSMDGKGRALDNIFIERFWRTIKYEHIYLKPAADGKELYEGIKVFINDYNMNRRHESLNKSMPYKVYQQIP